MKIYSTNYFNTFIEVAEDTKAVAGTKPPVKNQRTVAEMQYELIANNPYKYTSDDVFFGVFANRKQLEESAYQQERQQFFSKGQPCFRASPLTKSYGFGIHSNDEGKVALFGMETDTYRDFLANPEVKKVKAMKSKR